MRKDFKQQQAFAERPGDGFGSAVLSGAMIAFYVVKKDGEGWLGIMIDDIEMHMMHFSGHITIRNETHVFDVKAHGEH